MIKQIGIDIIENKRIKLTNTFIKKILSDSEIAILDSLKDKKAKINFVSGRWSVKEAIIKTLDENELLIMNKISITYVDKKPVWINEKYKIHISISHENKFSVGMAVREND